MATENSGKSLLIVRYDWTLENVEKDFKTVASNLILFRGERVFRVALRHSGGHGPQAQTNLIFLAINLNKIGLRIVDVVCGMEGVDTQCRMNESKPRGKKEDHSDEGGLQLFTSNVDVMWMLSTAGNVRLAFKFTSKESSMNILTTRVISCKRAILVDRE